MHELVATIRAKQRERWRAGERVLIETYFAQNPELESNPEVAVDLIYAEAILREEFGDVISADEYTRRFPKYADEVERQFEFEAMIPSGGWSLPPARPTTAAALPEFEGYDVVCRLGRVGRGVVYLARQRSLNRMVAIKVIRDEADPVALDLLRREAETVARLQHASIVQVYDFGDSGQAYFVMEYVEGGSLAQKLAGGPLPFREAAELVEALALAVQAAHESGVVHRDLKPANVLLTPGGAPKVADFGLAKLLDNDGSLIASGAVVGTPCYMAPEQAECKKDVGPAADIYALGAILHEALSGKPPFRGATPFDTLRQVRLEEPPPLDRGSIPRGLDNIRLLCLRKNPEDRYGSAKALAEDLRRFLEGKPVAAIPPRWYSGVGRAIYRRRSAVVACGFAVLSAILLGTWNATSLQDPYESFRKQVRPTLRRLELGEAVDLAQDLEMPAFHVRGSPGVTTVRRAAEGLNVYSAGLGVVELLPSVPAKRYRVSAVLKHVECNHPNLSMVGVYCRGRHARTPEADMHWMELVRLNDLVTQGHPQPNRTVEERHIAWFKLARFCLTTTLRVDGLPYRYDGFSNDGVQCTYAYSRKDRLTSHNIEITMDVDELVTKASISHTDAVEAGKKFAPLRAVDWNQFEHKLRSESTPIRLPPPEAVDPQQTVGLVVTFGRCVVSSFRIEPLP